MVFRCRLVIASDGEPWIKFQRRAAIGEVVTQTIRCSRIWGGIKTQKICRSLTDPGRRNLVIEKWLTSLRIVDDGLLPSHGGVMRKVASQPRRRRHRIASRDRRQAMDIFEAGEEKKAIAQDWTSKGESVLIAVEPWNF